jgi:hypothetical protein
LEIIRRGYRFTLITTLLYGCLTGCLGKPPSLHRLTGYLRAERNLNLRISPGPIRSDSLRILGRDFRIDPERSISRLRGNPELWEKLLKELNNEK